MGAKGEKNKEAPSRESKVSYRFSVPQLFPLALAVARAEKEPRDKVRCRSPLRERAKKLFKTQLTRTRTGTQTTTTTKKQVQEEQTKYEKPQRSSI